MTDLEGREEPMNEEDTKTPQPEAPDAPQPPEAEEAREKPHRVRVVAAAIVAAVAVISAVAFAASPKAPATGSAGSAAPVADAAATEPVAVTIRETAPGMDASTSPVIVRVRGEEGTSAEGVDFCHAAPAADAIAGTATVDLAPGSYTVEFLPTVNADGSINAGAGARPLEVPAQKGSADDASADKGSGGSPTAPDASAEVETTPADKVTADQIADLQQKTQDAISRGDSTLTGEAGQKVAEKVAENASKAPAADAGKVEKAEKKASDAAAGAKPAQTAPKADSTQAPSKTDAPSSPKADPKPSAGSKPASSSKPAAHEHKWEAVYRDEPIYETRTKTVTDQAAWTENVYRYTQYTMSDGTVFDNYSAAKAYGLETGCAYSAKDIYETVTHPAVTHEETYQVQTGTRRVLAGYRCSCGATK